MTVVIVNKPLASDHILHTHMLHPNTLSFTHCYVSSILPFSSYHMCSYCSGVMSCVYPMVVD